MEIKLPIKVSCYGPNGGSSSGSTEACSSLGGTCENSISTDSKTCPNSRSYIPVTDCDSKTPAQICCKTSGSPTNTDNTATSISTDLTITAQGATMPLSTGTFIFRNYATGDTTKSASYVIPSNYARKSGNQVTIEGCVCPKYYSNNFVTSDAFLRDSYGYVDATSCDDATTGNRLGLFSQGNNAVTPCSDLSCGNWQCVSVTGTLPTSGVSTSTGMQATQSCSPDGQCDTDCNQIQYSGKLDGRSCPNNGEICCKLK